MRRPSPLVSLALMGVGALIVGSAALSTSFYRAGVSAATSEVDASSRVWLGPEGPALERAVDDKLRSALEALNGTSPDPPDRMSVYRSDLHAARTLLRRAVLADLADTRALQRLAAVDWELGVMDGALDVPNLVALVAIAGARAPRVPEIQAELGDILFKLGRPDDATGYMAKAIALSPERAFRVAPIMLAAGQDPSEIVAKLPPAPEVLVALVPAYASAGRREEILGLIEARLPESPVRLIAPYGDLALSLGQADRVRSRLDAMGELADPREEAERLLQLGRAAAMQGAREDAYKAGLRALTLWPVDPRHCEFAGSAAMEAGRYAEAETMLRDGIARLATADGSPGWRARLYRQLGEVFERTGDGDQALVCYRRALIQDPEEPIAKAKVARIESLLEPKTESSP